MTTEIKFKNKTYSVNLRDEADKSVLAEIFKYHEYRAVDEDIARATDPILDIGAHAGFFTLYARALNQKVKIFAIEPEANNLVALEKNLKNNKIKNVKVIPAALSGLSGERKIVISKDTHNHRLLAPNDEFFYDNVCHPRESGDPGCEKVDALSFSDLCLKNKTKSVSVMKMDIEGGEYEVFDHMSDHDFARIKCVIMEYHDISTVIPAKAGIFHRHQELEQKLRENGFGVQTFPSKFDKKMGFLVARNKRLSLRGGA